MQLCCKYIVYATLLQILFLAQYPGSPVSITVYDSIMTFTFALRFNLK